MDSMYVSLHKATNEELLVVATSNDVTSRVRHKLDGLLERKTAVYQLGILFTVL